MENFIKEYVIANSEQDDIHGFPHVQRVYNLCVQIGQELNADLRILKIAALMHDIGRNSEKSNLNDLNHAEISANIARKYLNSFDSEISKSSIDKIVHCIRAHSFSNKIKPNILEAKILSDVDKLDALGAIGLYRTIGFTIKNRGGIDQVIRHLKEKILVLKNLMYLDATRKIAEQREQLILDFYNQILGEL